MILFGIIVFDYNTNLLWKVKCDTLFDNYYWLIIITTKKLNVLWRVYFLKKMFVVFNIIFNTIFNNLISDKFIISISYLFYYYKFLCFVYIKKLIFVNNIYKILLFYIHYAFLQLNLSFRSIFFKQFNFIFCFIINMRIEFYFHLLT